jgi:osmotically-inducible protein OsmY
MKTDAQLKDDVIAELSWEPSVNATRIGVEVKDGIVTLTGHVDSYAEKWHAESAAQRVSGVRALAVEMDVTLGGSARRTDAEIANSVQDVLRWTTNLPMNSVKIMVEGGSVTLSGEVEWDYQRRIATNALRHLIGVEGINNNLAIKPRASSGAIKADIEAALKRRAQDDARHISVEVCGSDVTLTGTVHSLSERELVASSAWGTPGVQKVVDHITIAP